MHFFYIDESGDTGKNLDDPHQPVVVLGGISVRDEGWNATQELLSQKLRSFFGGALPHGFELHAKDLLSPAGDGFYAGSPLSDRCALCLDLVGLLAERSHGVHYIALDKRQVRDAHLGIALSYDAKQPYLVAFDYLITYINWFVRERLGASARGLIILDKKEELHRSIETLLHERRFTGAAAHRVKWVVEFGYSVDSKKNPMVQLSDLVIYCIKRFLEVEKGYRAAWSNEAKNFYARCYSLLRDRIARSVLVERKGRRMGPFNAYVKAVRIEPRVQWKRHYDLGNPMQGEKHTEPQAAHESAVHS